jgi:acylphosphatase
MSDHGTLHLRIRGRVQGVGFRYAMQDQARSLGVAGWVRNRRDGSVEAMIQGPAGALEALREWSRRGPPGAEVTGVDAEPAAGAFVSFEVLPTL